MSNTKKKTRSLQLNIRIQGLDVDNFEAFKASEFLLNNSEAARKLMLERLAQIQGEGRNSGEKAA